MVTDEVPGNSVNGAAIIDCTTPATITMAIAAVIADEVPGNTVNGTAIINCSANYRSVIGYKISGNITDGTIGNITGDFIRNSAAASSAVSSR